MHVSECGVKDPSWAELNHFLQFLNIQLRSCEESVFCNEVVVGDTLPGLKKFAVKFMIKMAKVTILICSLCYIMRDIELRAIRTLQHLPCVEKLPLKMKRELTWKSWRNIKLMKEKIGKRSMTK